MVTTPLYIGIAAAFAIWTAWLIAVGYRTLRQDPLIAKYTDIKAVPLGELIAFGVYTLLVGAGIVYVFVH
jgi:hypothetical protein